MRRLGWIKKTKKCFIHAHCFRRKSRSQTKISARERERERERERKSQTSVFYDFEEPALGIKVTVKNNRMCLPVSPMIMYLNKYA